MKGSNGGRLAIRTTGPQPVKFRRRRRPYRQANPTPDRTADRGQASAVRNPLAPLDLARLTGPQQRQRRRVGVDTARAQRRALKAHRRALKAAA